MTDPAYIELHAHSAYSLLRGTSPPESLVAGAAHLGMRGLALTDHNNVYGAVGFQKAAQALDIQPILGAELTIESELAALDDEAGGRLTESPLQSALKAGVGGRGRARQVSPLQTARKTGGGVGESGAALTLLVATEAGWENLCWLITQAQHQAPKGEGLLRFDQLGGRTDGLIALSGGREGEIAHALEAEGMRAAGEAARRYAALFDPGCFWIELHHHRRPYDDQRVAALVELAESLKLGYVAANHVHYPTPAEKPLGDVLAAIRHNRSLNEARGQLFPNGQHYLKPAEEMAALFHRFPRALSNTLRIAEACRYQLPSQLQALPQYPLLEGMSAQSFLTELCRGSDRYRSHMEERLRHELHIIETIGLANYFLVVWDIVHFAWERGIRCQGRGSAANSVVAYLLKIAPVDPIKHRLVFERFLSEERQMTPDIDMDFDAETREEVIQYLYQKYGRTHAAMACTFVTYRHRSVIRDVAKAWGFAPAMHAILRDHWEERGENTPAHLELFFDTCEQLLGNVRHIGIHNGGEIISDVPLSRRLPTEPAAMPDRTVVQWDKEALEDAGIIKIDVLGLRMLAAISEMVERAGIDAESIPFDDPRVYQMITEAKTFGVFQCESRAQMNTLPRLKPTRFLDLVIAISLIRPGPIMGNMVHPYLRRRRGVEEVSYLDERLKPALEETLGVILWQEQVLKVAHDIARFSHGQGEMLRRALGSKYSFQLLDQLETVFMEGALENGVDEEVAATIFGQLRGFGAYSFAKSHAASFAVLTYQSAWFKYHHPAIFYAAILNHQPMGFWSPSTLVYDAMRQGIRVLAPDINHSAADCSVQDGAIRIGLSYVKGLKSHRLDPLLAERARGPFADLGDFIRRVKLPLRLIERLIQAGALDRWHRSRHQLLWDAGLLYKARGRLPLRLRTPKVELPEPTALERLNMEFGATGLSTEHHPMQYFRKFCDERGILHSKGMMRAREGTVVETAGMVVIIQAPETAKEIRFITLEDEFELINVVVFPDMYQRTRKIIRGERFLWFKGLIERDETVTTLRATGVRALPLETPNLPSLPRWRSHMSMPPADRGIR
ncbi:MAG: error-prone DNA polymerase [Chloroflexi bacterium]|nr:error-prone DNA polymerase [Chloroflexota bacterium]